MSDYPMLISNKLHSFRNFPRQIAIVRYIGGKIRRFIMMQPKDYSSFGCIIYMFNLRAFYSTPKSL